MRPRRPRMRPSASSASSTDARCPRPCGAAIEVLAPVLDPLDRPPELERGQRDQRRLDRQRALGAERAADVGDDHADRRSSSPRICASCARGRCALCDEDQTVSRSSSRRRERAAGLHRRRRQARDHVLGAHDVGGARERARDVARPLLPARELGARPRVEDRRQDLVVDLDAIGGVLGLGARLADDDRDRLADVRAPRRPPARDAARRRRSIPAARPRVAGTARPAMSAAVHSAPRTPRTRACACGLRTNAMCSMPSSRMSSRNSERPDRIRSSSRRRTGRPIDPAAPTDFEGICGKLRLAVKLRLYHHPDGARIAYREAGTGTRRSRCCTPRA